MSTLVLGAATLFDMSSAKRGKSLSEAENERLRKVIREKLLPRYDNNQSLAGPAIGLTQGGISRILVGGRGLARHRPCQSTQQLRRAPKNTA